jgi:formyltetrahydrofolate deformylase
LEHSYRLVISCPDKVGIVAEVSRFVAELGGWLLEASYHADEESGWFFMRNEIKASSLSVSLEEFSSRFDKIAKQYAMQWFISESNKPKKMLIMASHASHCVADLLHRWHSDDLFCEIPAVISNHEKLRSMVEWHDIPFHYVPISKETKSAANDEIAQLVEKYDADLIVLARYMQIIPDSLCAKYPGKIINIHHSFLPSFIGANPYQKAHERGVKLMGATCHYVTAELDEGPIIEQDVMRVNHRHSTEAMVRLGKDVEASVLSRGIRYHLEDRVIVHGNKTVILE